MSKHTIDDLRRHLFAALDGLTNKDAPMEIDRAKAVAEVAQTIINSAKVEVDHMKKAGGRGTGFLGQIEAPDDDEPRTTRTPTGVKVIAGAVTTHRLK